MSASASKKKRKELDAQGLSAKEIHAKKETDKRKKTRRNIILVVVAVLLVAAIVWGIIALLNRRYTQNVATVGDSKISIPVYNCFYNSTAIEVSQQGIWVGYGYYPVSITGGVPFSEQNSPLGEGSLEDFMIDYTNSRIQSVYNLYNKAQSDSSFSLSQEGKDNIATTLKNIKTEAKEHGFSSADKYLQTSVGRGVTLDDYETYLTVTTIASEYDAFIRETFDPSEEELAAAYNEDPSAYDIVSYTYSDTNATGAVDKESEDKEIQITDEDRAKAKQEAEAKETDMPDNATETHIQKSSLSNEELADWLFDDARKEGDVETFQMDEEGNSYRTVRFNSRDDNDYCRVNAYVIAIEKDKSDAPAESADSETTKTETPDAETPDAEAPETEAPETEAPETEAPDTEAPETEAPETEAPETEAPETEAPETEAPETEAPDTEAPADDEEKDDEETLTAEETLAKIVDGLTAEMTDEEFEAYIKEQYKAVSSTVVDKNDYPEAVNDYLFSADRKAGDYETITTDDTYYVVRYVSTNEKTYRNELVKSALFSDLYNEIMSSATIKVEDKVLREYAHTDLTFYSSSAS